MALSSESKFGVKALTAAVNKVPATPTQIRDLGIFEPQHLTTSYVDVECQEGRLNLVQSKERGTGGDAVPSKARNIRTFRVPHLPVDDVVRADDVQNLRAFGTDQLTAVEDVVMDKLADGKLNLEYTREHLMLGALQGKILDADGSELYDLYKEFGVTRGAHNWKLGTKTTEVGVEIDKTISALRAQVARVATEGVSEAELHRVKTQWVASEVYKRDSVMGQAQELGSMWAQGLPPDASERLIERLRQVTPAQVQAVAGKYFGDEQLTVGTLVPQPGAVKRGGQAAPSDALR